MARDREPDVRATRAAACNSRTTMCPGDKSDDRQPEARSRCAACVVGPAEAIESAIHELRREPAPLVGHVKLDGVT